MKLRTKPTDKKSLPVLLAIGTGISCIMTVLGAMLAAYLVHIEVVGQTALGLCAMPILVVSAGAGSAFSSIRYKENRVVVCLAQGLCYFLLLLAFNILFFGGEFVGFWVSLLMVALGAALAMLPVMHKKGGKRKYKIPAYR